MSVVVDTNVAVVANGYRSEQASADCVLTCTERLDRIMSGEVKLVLDNRWKIIDEYSRNLRSSGQPGVGDAFLRWVLTNWRKPQQCELVPITPIDDLENDFQEFPTDPALNDFDPDDRKFIAVALAHSQNPPILQAVDSKWWEFRYALQQNGVTVEFICEDDIQRLQKANP
jgi:hypothetical protein